MVTLGGETGKRGVTVRLGLEKPVFHRDFFDVNNVLSGGKFSTNLSPSGRIRQVQNTTTCHNFGTMNLNRISTVRVHAPYKYPPRITMSKIYKLKSQFPGATLLFPLMVCMKHYSRQWWTRVRVIDLCQHTAHTRYCSSVIVHRFCVPNNTNLWVWTLSLFTPQKHFCSVFLTP